MSTERKEKKYTFYIDLTTPFFSDFTVQSRMVNMMGENLLLIKVVRNHTSFFISIFTET